MKHYTIACIVGSIRKASLNRKLADALTGIAPGDFSFSQIRIDDLPLYSEDDEMNPGEAVRRLKGEVGAADALLFVTPEYNRSVPGVLKNAIDHASRPYGHSVWKGKPAGVIGISPGAIGTALAQQHLRTILSYLDVPAFGQPEAFIQSKDGLFNEDGSFGEASSLFMQSWMDRFVSWVRVHAAGKSVD
jgi:chromate reductase, NAD(P)H dehydrogenase (quinone)